ncbi:MAG TPA: VCBS domain-containing protein [Allosphingosinicella sp.]|uniref:Ig-like domain-containing protein n=1 Tax=Allosphingosinicella sp. TaxID=2823234 RepID=UPI002ED9EE8D
MAVAAALQAAQLIPAPGGVVNLPAGVSLDDIKVSGRDLVITLPDGSQMVIADGAIFVPQLVIGNVEVPAINLAALLIGQEPEPAAGAPRSSGGNFAVAVPELDPGTDLGDLLPPTALLFGQPEYEEILYREEDDEDPGVIIVTPETPLGAVAASTVVNEAGLPARGSEPPGSNSAGNSETTTGTIVITSGDQPITVAVSSVSVNGVIISSVGQTIATPLGTMTITSISPSVIGYTYTLADNTLGNATSDNFTVVITDTDGQTAQATLVIAIVDDAPTARADTDGVAAGSYGPATGNVVTGSGTTSGTAGADTAGADGVVVSGARAGSTAAFTSVSGATTIIGQYGVLTINADGSYSYVRNAGTPGGVSDLFSYQLTDGDGDTSTATLTIAIGDSSAVVIVPTVGEGTVVDESGLPPRGIEPPGSESETNVETTAGTITYTAPDGPAVVTVEGVTITTVGQVITVPGGTLTITSITPGAIGYTFTLTDNASTDPATIDLDVTVTDADGDTATDTLTITIVDDTPTARDDSASPAEDAPMVINVLANDTSGADGVNLATGVTLGTSPMRGAVVYNGDGTFTYTPTPGEEGQDSFTYTIRDADGDVSTATVTITLAADSEPQIDVGAAREVFEAGLPQGSDAASNSETASGSFAISTGNDSIASLVINGQNVTGGGTVTTATGILTVTLSGGVYGYSYTLTDPTSGDGAEDTFLVTVTDSDGSQASDTLVIDIVDDVPNAEDDSNSIAEDAVAPIAGDVLANDLHPNGQPGADTPTSFVGWNSTAASYGTFTDTGNGTYSYTLDSGNPAVQALDAGQTLTETFSYTMQDADGDTSVATLTITINGTNDTPTITADPGNEGGNDLVFEAGLATGSDAGSGSISAGGTFTVSDADGLDDLQSVTINGTTVAIGSLVGSVFSGANGTLTVTAYNAATGVATYSYVLTSPTTDGSGVEADTFTLSVSDGTTSSVPASIVIGIVDDLPNAEDDSNSVEEGAVSPSTGDVLANDLHPNGQPGADTPTSFVGWDSTAASYGTFTDTGNGTYSYTLDNGNPLVQALAAGATLTETFSYTMQDADGDTSVATLTITIIGTNDRPTITVDPGNEGANDQVFEAGLATGSDAASNSEFATGTFTLSDGDGLSDIDSVTINGVTVAIGSLAGSTFNGPNGSLTITAYDAATGVATYSYELTSPTTDLVGVESNTFTLTVSDGTSSSSPASIFIEIVDDVPNGVDDSNSIAEDTVAPVTGNVLTNDLHPNGQTGADTPTSFIGWDSTTASYGTFTDTGNGAYSYTLDNSDPAVQALDAGQTLTETFDYTMEDADGDIRQATLTITITGTNDTPTITADPGNQGANDQVSEAGLATGSAAASSSEFATGTFTLSDPDGLDDIQSVTINGITVSIGSLVGSTFNAPNGTLTINAYDAATGVATYSYELTSPTADLAGNESNTFTLTVSDGTASSTPASIVIEIVDDVPNAVDDSNSLTEDTVAPVTGDVLANDLHPNGQPGADTPISFVGWLNTTAAHGTFTANADGTYSYTLNSGSPAVQGLDTGQTLTETFGYTMQDADGDVRPATLTITITGSNDTPTITADPGNGGANDQVFEAGLASGSNAASNSEFATGTFTITDADGLDDIQSVTINGITVAIGSLAGSSFVGPNGTLTVTAYNAVTGVATYSYQLTSPTTDVMGVESNTFTLSVSDGTASSAPASIVIEIVDDVPNAVNDSNSIAEDTVTPVTGNVLTNDLHPNGQPGADTPTSFVGWDSTAASYGTFTDTGNGTYSYTLDNGNPLVQALPAGATLTETFNYTMRDADGDVRPATLTITITGTNDTPTVTVPTAGGPGTSVSEAGLPARGLEPEGTNEPSNVETTTGQISYTNGDGISTVKINGVTVTVGATVTGDYGTLTVTGIVGNVISYSYTLTENVDHDTDGTPYESFTVTVADSDGNPADDASATFQIQIGDDAPTLSSAEDLSIPNQVASHSGDIGFEYGADGGAITLTALTSIPGITYTGNGTGTITASVNGNPYFTITVNQETGEYTVDVVSTRPVVNSPLNIAAIAPGNYTTITVGDAIFDGVSFGAGTTLPSQFTNDGSTINPSGNGFGVANNLVNDNEGFLFTNNDSSALTFDVNFQPNTNQVTISYAYFNGTTWVNVAPIVVNKEADGVNTVTLDPPGDVIWDQMIVRFDYSGNGAARVENFVVTEQLIPDNQVISFGVTVTDNDGDVVSSSTPGTTIDLTFQGGAPVPTSLAVESQKLSQTTAGLNSALLAAGLVTIAGTEIAAASDSDASTSDVSVAVAEPSTTNPEWEIRTSENESKELVEEDESSGARGQPASSNGKADDVSSHSDADGDAAEDVEASELLQNSEVAADTIEHVEVTVEMAAMPVIDGKSLEPAVSQAPVEGGEALATVLADSLDGGSSGPDIQAVLDTLGGGEGLPIQSLGAGPGIEQGFAAHVIGMQMDFAMIQDMAAAGQA